MKLTPIERALVLQYLRDANVPVTISNKDNDTTVLPVIARSTNGEFIELQEPAGMPAGEAKDFLQGQVVVEFYFNKMGLTFTSEMTWDGEKCLIAVPEAIERIPERAVNRDTAFDCSIYYSCSNNAKVNFKCLSEEGYTLFARPVWKDIATEHQYLAKTYLEQFVKAARAGGAYNNGLFLIPICRYLTDVPRHLYAVEGRMEPFTALYIDHERLVFGSDCETFPMVAGAEYAMKMSFALHGSLRGVSAARVVRPRCCNLRREILTTARLMNIYRGEHSGNRVCADCVFTSLKEEDKRYLYEAVLA